MGLFTPKSLLKRRHLAGATDWHCHLLPGVDDGVRTLDETLECLGLYEEAGVAEVWLTPHVMEDVATTPADLRATYDTLLGAYHGPIRLHLAAEHMLDPLFEKRLQAGEVMPLGERGKHLLVETSYYSPSSNFLDLLDLVKEKGYQPVLAHPERYIYMDDGWYHRLLSTGLLFQMNIFSLVGAYGPEARMKARALLKGGAYSLFGTDTHRASQFAACTHAPCKEKEIPLRPWNP